MTPLQMALVAAAVANGGKLMSPHLVRTVKDRGRPRRASEDEAERAERRDEAASTAAQLTQMMSQGGEGGHRAPRPRCEGIDVAGKTGTAEVGRRLNQAWFIGFAPVENPRVAIAVTVERTTGPGRDGGRADRQAGAGGAAAARADDAKSRRHDGRRPLPRARAGSAPAGWPTSTAPRTPTSAARSR